MRRDERPRSLQPLPVQANRQPAVGLLLDELVCAVVPDLDGACAIVPLRDLARERRIVERMVFDVDGERTLADVERDPLRHRPGRERTVPLEPEVVMEAAGVVTLDDEDRLLRPPALLPERLGRLLRIAFPPVFAELFAARSHGQPSGE